VIVCRDGTEFGQERFDLCFHSRSVDGSQGDDLTDDTRFVRAQVFGQGPWMVERSCCLMSLAGMICTLSGDSITATPSRSRAS
jgi:hypothetical protein